MWLCYWPSLVFISNRAMELSIPNTPLLLLQGHASSAIGRYRCAKGSKLLDPLLKTSHSSPTTMTLLTVLQFTAQTPCADAVHDLTACGARVREQQNAVRNTTYPPGPPPVLRISYEECLVDCGAGMLGERQLLVELWHATTNLDCIDVPNPVRRRM